MKIKPVLMIVTSHSSLGTTGKPTGIWAEELTTPYYVLSDAGFEVVISSPQGERPPLADGSVKADPTTNVASVTRFFADKIAMLMKALRTDGKSILQGRRVNGFTNAEEVASGLMNVVPFQLETVMRHLGGIFENGPLWSAYAVRDGNLITGQNPASSALVAQHAVAALQGRTL
jgi:putative intracellular protease/amidase